MNLCRTLGFLRSAQKGQSLVETALVLPVLLILTFGVIEMSMYMYSYLQAASCAREAARRASVRAAGATDPQYCTDTSLTISVSPSSYASAPAGSQVVAIASGTHEWIVLDNLIDLPAWNVEAKVTMRLEGQKI